MGFKLAERFYSFDFWLFNYYNEDNKNIELIYKETENNPSTKFTLVYIESGEVSLTNKGGKQVVGEGNIILKKQFDTICIETIPNVDSHVVLFDFSGSLLHSDEASLLRCFDYNEGENAFDLKKLRCKQTVVNSINLAQQYIRKNLQKGHFLSVLKMILSELCIALDDVFPKIAEKYSKDYNAKIYDYICRNFNKNIPISEIAETFFVSKGYINNLCKRFYNLPYKQMIIDIRMHYARALITRETNITLKKVAEMCGYKEYSAFYRAYTNYFGKMPKK